MHCRYAAQDAVHAAILIHTDAHDSVQPQHMLLTVVDTLNPQLRKATAALAPTVSNTQRFKPSPVYA
jgi:hypothetical protein